MHENFGRTEEKKASTDRSFGLVMAAFFTIVAVLPLFRTRPESIRWWALGVAVAFAGTALLWTAPLAPLSKLWMRFGGLLHAVISPIFLALIFYTTVTPVGLLARLFGKDLLRLRRDPAASSYWIQRDPPGPSPESMKNQF